MKLSILGGVCAVLLAGCSASQDADTAMDAASTALNEANRANRSLDAGSGSGTTMGDELQALQQRLDDVEQENRQLRADVDQLESKISYVESQQHF